MPDNMGILTIWGGSTLTLFKYADDSTIVAPVWKRGSDTSSGLVGKFFDLGE